VSDDYCSPHNKLKSKQKGAMTVRVFYFIVNSPEFLTKVGTIYSALVIGNGHGYHGSYYTAITAHTLRLSRLILYGYHVSYYTAITAHTIRLSRLMMYGYYARMTGRKL
jgi:hypothetical protein